METPIPGPYLSWGSWRWGSPRMHLCLPQPLLYRVKVQGPKASAAFGQRLPFAPSPNPWGQTMLPSSRASRLKWSGAAKVLQSSKSAP